MIPSPLLPIELQALTEAQVRNLLGLSRNSVRQLRLHGSLPFFRVGRSVRYPAAGLARFIENSASNGEPDASPEVAP